MVGDKSAACPGAPGGSPKGNPMSEQYEVRGTNLVRKIKEILREGNVRRLSIRNEEGRELIEVPLSIGVVGTLLLPAWAAIGAIAALVTNCTIVVERHADDEGPGSGGDDGGDGDGGDDAGEPGASATSG